jgi:hypothetical protein
MHALKMLRLEDFSLQTVRNKHDDVAGLPC